MVFSCFSARASSWPFSASAAKGNVFFPLGLYTGFYRLVLYVKNSPSVSFFEVETKQTMPSLAPACTRVHPLCTPHAWLRGEDRVALPSLHSKQRIKHVVLNRPFFWQENIQTPRLFPIYQPARFRRELLPLSSSECSDPDSDGSSQRPWDHHGQKSLLLINRTGPGTVNRLISYRVVVHAISLGPLAPWHLRLCTCQV